MRRLLFLLLLTLLASTLLAGDGKLMHCFYFTVIEGASSADWQAFHKATDELPGKIPGLLDVWYGKLSRPLRVGSNERQYGVCMEMESAASLKAYADHPAHKAWEQVYFKVRQPGTTTVDMVGE